jgi:hypothetical protein
MLIYVTMHRHACYLRMKVLMKQLTIPTSQF